MKFRRSNNTCARVPRTPRRAKMGQARENPNGSALTATISDERSYDDFQRRFTADYVPVVAVLFAAPTCPKLQLPERRGPRNQEGSIREM